eukprot:jgi/Tetstr1/439441/TSEL_027875.t1
MATETAASLFGTHNGITCDGCGTKPIIGFRYKCKNCPNHDFCEACYEDFGKGTLRDFTHRQNPVSKKLEDHAWEQHVNHKDFKSSVKQGDGGGVKAKKVKPNEPCTCGSGKKYKKCCGAGAA